MDIIIIQGAPGSGKSETAKNLSIFFPKGVLIEIDTIRKMIISVDWTNQKEHTSLLSASIPLIIEFINLQFIPIILVDTFSGNKISDFMSSLYNVNANVLVKIFTLYASNDELEKRLELRPFTKFKDFTIAKKINDEFANMHIITEFKIDTTGIDATEAAKIIYNNLPKKGDNNELLERNRS